MNKSFGHFSFFFFLCVCVFVCVHVCVMECVCIIYLMFMESKTPRVLYLSTELPIYVGPSVYTNAYVFFSFRHGTLGTVFFTTPLAAAQVRCVKRAWPPTARGERSKSQVNSINPSGQLQTSPQLWSKHTLDHAGQTGVREGCTR